MISAVDEDGIKGILERRAVQKGFKVAGAPKHSMVDDDGFRLACNVFDAV